MLREPTVAGIGQLAAMQIRGAVIWGGATADRRERCREIERELADFAHAPNGSLIVPLSVFDRPPSAPTAGDLS
jgi:hypothetical protein